MEQLVAAFFNSWQVKTLLGLILLDVLLGVAQAIRRGAFDPRQFANFYRTNVVPYLVGYLALFLAVEYVIPREAWNEMSGSGLGDIASDGVLILAWGALVGHLGASIKDNFFALYGGPVKT